MWTALHTVVNAPKMHFRSNRSDHILYTPFGLILPAEQAQTVHSGRRETKEPHATVSELLKEHNS